MDEPETTPAPDAGGETPDKTPGETPGDAPEATTGRERLWAALRRPGSRGQITAAVLLALVGFASVVQVQSTERDDVYEGARQEDLIQLLNSLAAASQRAENEIAQLEETRSSLRSDTDSRRAALEQARQQANVLGILAGTLPAVGPGVVITIEDPTGAVGANNLLNGLEELRDAGAEAIEINDSVRVVAQTYLRDGENGVVIDGHPVAPPYKIEAIGDPRTMAQAVDFAGGFTDDVELVSGSLSVEESNNVEVATVRDPSAPEFAEPVDPQ